MLFNNSKIIAIMPKFTLGNEEINLVEELKVLGVVLSSDLKWNSHTDHIITSAFKKVWMLRRLKSLGTALPELKDIYIQHVRSILEFAVPVWHSGLTQCNRSDIERVQKSAMHIILGDSYTTYENALRTMDLETLESRRSRLCSKFAIKSLKHPKHSKWFKVNKKTTVTRQPQPKFCPVVWRTNRFKQSPISYLTDVLNKKYTK